MLASFDDAGLDRGQFRELTAQNPLGRDCVQIGATPRAGGHRALDHGVGVIDEWPYGFHMTRFCATQSWRSIDRQVAFLIA